MSRKVTLFTRRACSLCDAAAAELTALSTELRFDLTAVDIDEDAALREQYNDIVPVIAVDDQIVAHAPIAPGELREALLTALG
jgi:glutaredoxin